jgi:hypothetical protein
MNSSFIDHCRAREIRFLHAGAPAAKHLAAAIIGLTLSWHGEARAEAEAPGAETPSARADEVGDRDSRVHVGVLGGIGFPRPLALEGLIGVGHVLALGAEYSVLPTTTISGVETRFWALAADARVFPFGGAFFLGARAGHQHLSGSTTVAIPSIGAASGALAVDTWFVNPRAGFLWMWHSGLALGIDAGVQVPIASNMSTTIPSGLSLDPRVTRVADALGKDLVPTIDLLRIGLVL